MFPQVTDEWFKDKIRRESDERASPSTELKKVTALLWKLFVQNLIARLRMARKSSGIREDFLVAIKIHKETSRPFSIPGTLLLWLSL